MILKISVELPSENYKIQKLSPGQKVEVDQIRRCPNMSETGYLLHIVNSTAVLSWYDLNWFEIDYATFQELTS
jgi:hypothetical protein